MGVFDILSAGRMFDAHVLDMFEFGIQKFKSLQEVHVSYCYYLSSSGNTVRLSCYSSIIADV